MSLPVEGETLLLRRTESTSPSQRCKASIYEAVAQPLQGMGFGKEEGGRGAEAVGGDESSSGAGQASEADGSACTLTLALSQ